MLSTMTPFQMTLLVISLAIFINTAVCPNKGFFGWGGKSKHSKTTDAGPSEPQTGHETEHSDDENTAEASQIKQWSETYFRMGHEIGDGSFSRVVKAKSRSDGKVYAIKKINKGVTLAGETSMTPAEIKNEIDIQRNLNNKFIVQLYDAFESHEAFYLQLEMVKGGSLFELMDTVGSFEENIARFYAAEIMCGLEYLHNNDIIYRDLKPNNVLLTSEGHIKIADFGLSKQLGQYERTGSMRGTPGFMAPEIIQNQPYDKIVDSYSLGAMIYVMIYGWNNGGTLHRLRQTPINYDGFSRNASDLLWHLLHPNPEKRTDIWLIKEHPWFIARTKESEMSPLDWSEVENLQYKPPYIPKGNGKFNKNRNFS